MGIYEFKAYDIDNNEIDLSSYKGKVVLIVNTASKCGFTPQYEDLQKLYEEFNSKGFEILGFPCNQFENQEPEDESEVKNFCMINYGVDFTLFKKINVRGSDSHELFKYLTKNAPFEGFDLTHPIGKILQKMLEEKFPEYLIDDSIKWNFTKFLVNKDGKVVKRFEPTTLPFDMKKDIENLL